MDNKNKIITLSIIIALVALLLLIASIAIVGVSQKKKASIDNIIDPFSAFDKITTDIGNIVNIFDGDRDSDGESEDDDTPPATITNLQATDVGPNYIYWTWTNPGDSDFYRAIVYLDSVQVASTSDSYYNATGLTDNTAYTITVHTMDDEGNVNSNDINNTQTTGTGGPGTPVISNIPDITFGEDGSDNTLDLDDYVTDSDHALSELIWTYSGNTNVNVNIAADNVVTFTATTNWFGSEFITFRATDPDNQWDEDTTLVEVTSIDDITIWNSLTDQTIQENENDGTIIYNNIYSEVSDPDTPFTISVISINTHFNVQVTGNDLTIHNLQNNWNGNELVVLEANGITASFTLFVSAENDDPYVSNSIPNVEIDEDDGNVNNILDLEDYFDDAEDGPSGLTYTISSQSNTGVVTASIDGSNRIDLQTVSNQYGESTIKIRARDSEGESVTDTFRITVNSVDDDAVWQSIVDRAIWEDAPRGTRIYNDIASRASDVDSSVSITVDTNTHFRLAVVGDDLNMDWMQQNWYGSEIVTVYANNIPATFTLTVNKLLDDCQEICSWGTCYTFCD